MPYDLKNLGRWCIALTWLYVALAALSLLHTIWEMALGHGIVDAIHDPDPDGTYSERFYWAVFGITIPVLIVNGIWIYRAAATAQALDPVPGAVSPRWSVGWYFVPIANLWMPLRAMRETWASAVGTGWPLYTPALLTVWWIAWVVSSVLGRIADRVARAGQSYEDYVASLWYYLPSEALDIVAGICFALIIRRVTDGLMKNERESEIFA